jgi:hypothetical protein
MAKRHHADSFNEDLVAEEMSVRALEITEFRGWVMQCGNYEWPKKDGQQYPFVFMTEHPLYKILDNLFNQLVEGGRGAGGHVYYYTIKRAMRLSIQKMHEQLGGSSTNVT